MSSLAFKQGVVQKGSFCTSKIMLCVHATKKGFAWANRDDLKKKTTTTTHTFSMELPKESGEGQMRHRSMTLTAVCSTTNRYNHFARRRLRGCCVSLYGNFLARTFAFSDALLVSRAPLPKFALLSRPLPKKIMIYKPNFAKSIKQPFAPSLSFTTES